MDREDLEFLIKRLKNDVQLCQERLKNPKPEDGDALKSRLRLAIMNVKMQIKTLEEKLDR